MNFFRTSPKPVELMRYPGNIFYDIRKGYEEQGIEGLRENNRRKPCLKNCIVLEAEEAVVNMTSVYPANGQTWVPNELWKQGIIWYIIGDDGAEGA